jgi:flagellar basal-body rod protein FlgC
MNNDVFTIIGSALTAQNARMGAIASNLANANSIAAPGTPPYRAHELVFAAADAADGETDALSGAAGDGPGDMGVTVLGSVEANAAPQVKYDPASPYADASGNVTGSNVRPADEMVNLIDSTTSYAASVAVLQQASRIDQQMLASFQVT